MPEDDRPHPVAALIAQNVCENAVHAAFCEHSDDPQTLFNRLGALYDQFGSDSVIQAMIGCLRVAYLKNRFQAKT